MVSSANRKQATVPRRLWSTGQISRLVGFDVKCVSRWIDQGYLKGVRLPGTAERRVHRNELRRFLVEHDYAWALDELDEEERSALSPSGDKGNGSSGNGRKKEPTPG